MLPEIHYRQGLEGVSAQDLEGFCSGWPSPLDGGRLLEVLRSSTHVWLAFDGQVVVGFANALSDGRLSAFVPMIEVREEYQRNGIGATLMGRMLATLETVYSVDLVCDPDVAPFYDRCGAVRLVGCGWRNRSAPVLAPSRQGQ